MQAFRIRKATPTDAAGIARIWQIIATERVHSAVDHPWSVEQQERYLSSLSSREAFQVAETESDGIIGFQSLDLWSRELRSMSHAGQLGTFLSPEWRRHGVGRALFAATLDFARSAQYRKFVVQVRASNTPALRFYEGLGFQRCGQLRRQVIIDGVEDDEILMELFL